MTVSLHFVKEGRNLCNNHR